MIKKLENKFKKIQKNILSKFEEFDDPALRIKSIDSWKRNEGGGGRTAVIANGDFFDNCAVNYSSIYGKKLPKAALKNNQRFSKNKFVAMGVSVISHPKNPHVPTSHMNVRLFCIFDKNNYITDWWIGGGYDLTPYLPYSTDIINWHKKAKSFLDSISTDYYNKFSEDCNNYFYIPHRHERRGIGGIFFDNLKDLSIEESVKFLELLAEQYLDSYVEIITKRRNTKYSVAEKEFQLVRRGRYVEFNLIYDRGTAFGLQSDGRIESILASLPAEVKWSYKKSKEHRALENKLLKTINKDWNV